MFTCSFIKLYIKKLKICINKFIYPKDIFKRPATIINKLVKIILVIASNYFNNFEKKIIFFNLVVLI